MKKFLLVFFVASIAILSGCKAKGSKTDAPVPTKDSAALRADSLRNDSIKKAQAKIDSAKAAEAEKHTEAYIKKRVEKMYNYSFGDEADHSKYFSTAFRKLYNKAMAMPEMIIEFDLWLRAQDLNNPVVVVNSVKVIDDTHATASVHVYPFGKGGGEDTNLSVSLVFERDNWFVDDFIANGKSDRKWIRAAVM